MCASVVSILGRWERHRSSGHSVSASGVSGASGGPAMDKTIIRTLKVIATIILTLVGIMWVAAALVFTVAVALTAFHVRIG